MSRAGFTAICFVQLAAAMSPGLAVRLAVRFVACTGPVQRLCPRRLSGHRDRVRSLVPVSAVLPGLKPILA